MLNYLEIFTRDIYNHYIKKTRLRIDKQKKTNTFLVAVVFVHVISEQLVFKGSLHWFYTYSPLFLHDEHYAE